MSEAPETPHGKTQASFKQLLLAGTAIGLFGGFAAYLYATVLHFLIGGIWDNARPFLAAAVDEIGGPGDSISLLVLTCGGGALVGLCLKRFGVPGEIAAVVNNIHLRNGRIPIKQTPSMLITSLVSISVGGSAGPEAPLVQVIGSAGSWLGDQLKWLQPHARTLTFCGMAAALGAFFGAPLAGAVFALEIPHRNGLEYYEALLPAIFSAFFSYWVFGALGGQAQPLYPLKWEATAITSDLLLKGILLGSAGALVAVLFTHIFRLFHLVFEKWSRHRILLGGIGGLLLGALAIASPSQLAAGTLFWGEFQMGAILRQVQGSEPSVDLLAPLTLLAGMKVLAVCVTLNSGFRGGFIFPLFFIGGTLGIVVSIATQGWIPLPIAVICLMAATNVGVTRTPISTTILLGTLTGIAATPLVLAASLTSFVLTARIQLIASQRSRIGPPSSLAWRDKNR